MRDEAQWILLLGLLVSIILFFLALIINQSVFVGRTTAENTLDFPKNDIRDIKSEIMRYVVQDRLDLISGSYGTSNNISTFYRLKKSAFVKIYKNPTKYLNVRYNNGMVEYNEIIFALKGV